MTSCKLTARLGLAVLVMLPWLGAAASEMVYQPINPTFGGNPANASGLMAAASAQNDFKAPTTVKTPLDRFTTALQNAVLSRLTTTAVSNLFDEDGKLLVGRTITAGNYTIAITSENGNLVMTTKDNASGASTRIVVGNIDSSSLAGE